MIIKYLKQIIKLLNHPANKHKKLSTILKIILWKVNQILLKMPFVVSINKNVKCLCYPDSSYGGWVFFTGLPEYTEMNFIQTILRPADVFIDVGASIGVYSLLAASKLKEGRIFAFEPSDDAAKIFEQNILLNNVQNKIELIKKIVSDKSGFEIMSKAHSSEESHILRGNELSSDNSRIPSVTIDSFITRKNIKKIKLLKVDVEGAEIKVLRGAESVLKRKIVDFLILEMNSYNKYYGTNHKDFIKILQRCGYRVYVFEKKQIRSLRSEDFNNKTTFNILASLRPISYSV